MANALTHCTSMIHLTRINQQQLILNSDIIEQIEATPDTVITMTNGQKLVVADSADSVIEKIIAFRRSLQQQLPALSQTVNRSETED